MLVSLGKRRACQPSVRLLLDNVSSFAHAYDSDTEEQMWAKIIFEKI